MCFFVIQILIADTLKKIKKADTSFFTIAMLAAFFFFFLICFSSLVICPGSLDNMSGELEVKGRQDLTNLSF